MQAAHQTTQLRPRVCDDNLLPLHLRPVRTLPVCTQVSPDENPGIATVSTITTGTAQSDQSAQTTVAPSSQASRTRSPPSPFLLLQQVQRGQV